MIDYIDDIITTSDITNINILTLSFIAKIIGSPVILLLLALKYIRRNQNAIIGHIEYKINVLL